jgi:tRNA dimethylallyltransferase
VDAEPGDGPQAILLLGPTASGKSRLALQLAERFDLEIVSVDSALVYRDMDIGTAKPSIHERAQVAHHLIDLIDPAQSYSAARFVLDAREAIAGIRSRGRLPLLVGGTMLYVRALLGGMDDLPAADPAIRARLDAEAAALGWPALHDRLSRCDPVTAARLPATDAQRIQRALEIFELTGRPMSSMLGQQREAAARQAAHWPILSLEPSDRSVLHARIAERLRAMVSNGLMDEVRRLRARGDLHLGLPAMRCVGYRQAWEALDRGDQAPEHRFLEPAVAATRQLAKRQLTWLRAMPDRFQIDCLSPQALDTASRQIARLGAPAQS